LTDLTNLTTQLINKVTPPISFLSLNEFLLDSPFLYFDELISSIRQAKHEILLEVYIFKLDSIGLSVFEALIEARKKGVRVYLMVDAIGSSESLPPLIQLSKKNGIFIKAFHPLSFNSNLNSFYQSLKILNKRNHRKLALIDESIVFMGSLNICQDHLKWQDLGLKLVTPFEYQKNPHLVTLKKSFFKIWSQSKKFNYGVLKKIPKFLTLTHISISPFLRNESVFLRFNLSRFIYKNLRSAQTRILICTPYFLPRFFLMRALYKAQKNGALISLVLPSKSDVWFVKWATQSLYKKLLKRKIKIFEFETSILHEKSLIIDDLFIIGSLNWNHRSFVHDLEIAYQTKSPETLQLATLHFDQLIKQSRPIVIDDLINHTPFYQLILGKMIYWFRYWL